MGLTAKVEEVNGNCGIPCYPLGYVRNDVTWETNTEVVLVVLHDVKSADLRAARLVQGLNTRGFAIAQALIARGSENVIGVKVQPLCNSMPDNVVGSVIFRGEQ